MSADPRERESPPCVIEEMLPSDFEEVCAAWEAMGFWPHVGEDRRWLERAIQRNPGLFLVARVERRIAGTVCGAWDGMRGWFYHFGVLEEFRRRGIGSALLAEVERRLRAMGVFQINLMVYDDNTDAMEFYLRRGYERSPVNTFRKRFAL